MLKTKPKVQHYSRVALFSAAASLIIVLGGCQDDGAQSKQSTESKQSISIADSWRAVLRSPGGELPFVLEIEGDSQAGYQAHIVNGSERAPVSGVALDGQRVELSFAWYDAEITAELNEDRTVMQGQWRKTAAEGDSTLPFRATRGLATRFLPQPVSVSGLPNGISTVAGDWAVLFTDDEGKQNAQAEFAQIGSTVTGTFLTPTGDYRFLEGQYEAGLLRLSTFDGAHAFLFTAQATPDGQLNGDFWSRDSYHATWSAVRIEEEENSILPDPWQLAAPVEDDAVISFSFPSESGGMLRLDDPRFAGKPMVINVFGTWCPNCNDEAPLLADWYRKYQPMGLEIVGVAFEYSGDKDRDMEMIRRFKQRHGITYPIGLGGTTDKSVAASALGFLDKVIAYPTTIFLNAEHQIVAVHSGFSGPGTGDRYHQLVSELEQEIKDLLAEYHKDSERSS